MQRKTVPGNWCVCALGARRWPAAARGHRRCPRAAPNRSSRSTRVAGRQRRDVESHERRRRVADQRHRARRCRAHAGVSAVTPTSEVSWHCRSRTTGRCTTAQATSRSGPKSSTARPGMCTASTSSSATPGACVRRPATWTDGKAVDTYGPWSMFGSFQSRRRIKGYIRGNELYDPLFNGETIGTIVDAVALRTGVGISLDSLGSYVAYQLQTPLIEGEFSMLAQNVRNTQRRRQDQGDGDVARLRRHHRRTIGRRDVREALRRHHGLARHHPRRSDRDRLRPNASSFRYQPHRSRSSFGTWTGTPTVFTFFARQGGYMGKQYLRANASTGAERRTIPNPHVHLPRRTRRSSRRRQRNGCRT